jgi:hypothetical protein
MEHDLPPELTSRRDELLARVTRRGRALRARRLGALATVVAVVVAVPITAVAVTREGASNDHVSVVAPTTTAPPPTSAAGRVCIGPTPTTFAPNEFPPRGDVDELDITVPDVAGKRVDDAARTLGELGLCIRQRTEQSSTVPAGVVIATDPPAATRVREGSVIEVAVSNGSDGATPVTTVPENPATVPPTSVDPGYRVPRGTVPIANLPAQIDVVRIEPNAPKVGDTVTFTVRAQDPDAMIVEDCGVTDAYSDTGSFQTCFVRCPVKATDPAAHVDEKTFTHRYDEAGTFTATFKVKSGSCDPEHGSEASTTVTMLVSP